VITTRGGTGSTYDGGGYDTTLAHLNAKQLGRVCEADKNPSLLSDTLKMLAASCPPKEILRLLFTGRTKTEPHRKGTNLTKMLGWGLLDGARISPELSTIKHYAKTHGPAYLGELVWFATFVYANDVLVGDDVRLEEALKRRELQQR